MEGLIIKNISDLYTVKSHNDYFKCKAKGLFRRKNIIPLVGDRVIFDDSKGVITDILERKNKLIRPYVSNVDQMLIVMSTVEPTFSTYLVDKLILMAEFNNIEPILCISKTDISNNVEIYLNYYKKIGYKVLINTDLNALKRILKNKITVITGQSGVGKSTLLNKLDSNLSLKTNEISHALGRGKHTTRHTELYEICDGYLIDTPGFSSLELNMSKKEIKDNIKEFSQNLCKYSDCMHINEDDCKIKDLVSNNTILKSRYDNYIKFISEIKDIY